jgi:hypothetical protein
MFAAANLGFGGVDEGVEEDLACSFKRDAVPLDIRDSLGGVPGELDRLEDMHDVHHREAYPSVYALSICEGVARTA